MKDVQKERDLRNIPINRVGVRGVSYPIVVMDRRNGTQATVASVSMSVFLPHEYRGTHMSRFIETLEEYPRVNPATLKALTRRLCEKLDASESSVRFQFPYFTRKAAPASGMESFMRYEALFEGTFRAGEGNKEEKFDMFIGVEVPVQTLCPCSKEISRYGAHNQRAIVRLKVRSMERVWFEELIQMAEDAASSPLYTLLKREDEKHVTEHAYENPRFVEDVARDLVLALKGDRRITWYSVSVTSAESIHNHDAFAENIGLKP